ncbi:MAG: BcpO-related WXXGXW repeat protein, partial [Planctomycetales bacterium]|nr:BcpO-related WXXGXW repeat protein [Planctomycetales bacterium]
MSERLFCGLGTLLLLATWTLAGPSAAGESAPAAPDHSPPPPAPASPPLPAAQLQLATEPADDAGSNAPGAAAAEAAEEGQHVMRGPVHEAFAERVERDPQPSPIIARQPPDPINELPPEVKPAGSDVAWIPGYWAWDDERHDFLWVSGIWRRVPPGRRWQPGYWTEVEGGYRWVSGTWAPAQPDPLALAPPPPANLDEGPNQPAPAADDIWIAGCWDFREGNFRWRPGFWSRGYDDWVWVPARYFWTPGGYAYCPGYWDYPVTYRGYLFAPFSFSRPVYGYAGYWFTPRVLLSIGGVFDHLWVRPSYRHYFFGDYYHGRYRKYGYHAWHDYHRRHYCPLLGHYQDYHRRHGIDYAQHRRRWHDQYTRHPDWRPPDAYRGNLEKHRRRGLADRIDGHQDHRPPLAVGQAVPTPHGHPRHARHRLDQFAAQGPPQLATGVDQLSKARRGDGDRQVQRAVFLSEPQRRAIGTARQGEIRDLIRQRQEAFRSRLATASSPARRQAVPRTAPPVAGGAQGPPAARRGPIGSEKAAAQVSPADRLPVRGPSNRRGPTTAPERSAAQLPRGAVTGQPDRSPRTLVGPPGGAGILQRGGDPPPAAAAVRQKTFRPPATAGTAADPVRRRWPGGVERLRGSSGQPASSAARIPRQDLRRGPPPGQFSRGPSAASRGPADFSRGPAAVSGRAA